VFILASVGFWAARRGERAVGFVGPVGGDSSRWRRISTVDIQQLPETKPGKTDFVVLGDFGFTTAPSSGTDGVGPFWRPADVEFVAPSGMLTDLASVPRFLWGVIASYGRQTLPAILHDQLCYAAAMPGLPVPFSRGQRREADGVFRRALELSGAGPVRRWLMWSAVRLGGRKQVFALFGATYALVVLAALAGALWPPLWLVAGAAAVALAVLALAPSRESRRAGRLAATAGSEYTAPRFEPRALGSLLGAAGIAVLAAPLLLPVTLITLATAAVVGLGEQPLPGAAGALPSGTGAAPTPAGALEGGEGATARIAWAPLVAPDRGGSGPGA